MITSHLCALVALSEWSRIEEDPSPGRPGDSGSSLTFAGPMTSNASPSLVVVTWQCADHLARLVSSLNRFAEPGMELVVVDNASADDPESEARAFRGDVMFIQLEQNEGFGAATNAGVESATRPGVVMLNPDTELVGPGLAALARFAVENRVLAGPRLIDPDGSVQASAAGEPVGAWPWLGAFVPGRLAPPPLRQRTEPWRASRTTRVAWLTGACLAGPRDILRELGPFDPRIHLYGEDMELGLRASRLGITSFSCPELARVIHHRRGSVSRRFEEGPEDVMMRNQRWVLSREYGPRSELWARRAQMTNLRLRLLAKRALRRPAAREARLLGALKRASAAEGPAPRETR